MEIIKTYAILGLAFIVVFAKQPTVYEGPNSANGEYIVALKNIQSDVDKKKFLSQVDEIKAAKVDRVFHVGRETFAKISVDNLESINEISLSEYVDFAESNSVIRTGEIMDVHDVTARHEAVRHKRSTQEHCTATYTENKDTDWGIVRTSHRSHPDPLSAPYIYGNDDGEGVDVYVIDSGVYTEHSDFEGRAWHGMVGDGVRERGEGEEDLNGHGTHIAGIIAGKKYGVARRANIISCKVIGEDGVGDWSDIVHAMEWIVNRMQWQRSVGIVPRAVISVSVTGEDLAYAAMSAIQAAIEEGALVTIPAGNLNIDACYYSPSRLATALTVAAIDKNDEFAAFSNFGPCVNILAPGLTITGPWIGYETRYVSVSGTAQAAAHVAGIAARHLSMYEDGEVPTSLEVRAEIIDTTTRGMINLPGDALGSTPNHLAYKSCDSSPKPNIRLPQNGPQAAREQSSFEWPDIPECPSIQKVDWPNDTIYTVLLGVLVLVCLALLQHILLIIGMIRMRKRCDQY